MANFPMDYGFDNCLKRLNTNRRQSNYERENDITASSDFHIIDDKGDIKFLEQEKTDGTKTFAIIFKSGRLSDLWLALVPSDNQVIALSEILPQYYPKLNINNDGQRRLTL